MSKHYHERDGTRVRKAYASKGDDCTFSRFVKVRDKSARMAAQRQLMALPRQMDPKRLRSPAIALGRSYFHRKGVKQPADLPNLLVSAHSNVKIGRDIRKGKLFQGYWIYTLSLEERKTCPNTCEHWADCYGNHMPYAKRIDHEGEGFLELLDAEIEKLLQKSSFVSKRSHKGAVARQGIMIRLHALGDFYSSEYVAFWAGQLAKHERLAIYGYTARKPESEIGRSIRGVKRRYNRRFAIRWSDGGLSSDSTISVEPGEEAPAGSFLCPEQTGASEACGKCGLCWNTEKNVAFITH